MRKIFLIIMLLGVTQAVLAIVLTGCGITGRADGQIAFTSERTGDWQVFVINADGTDARQLTYDDNYHCSY